MSRTRLKFSALFFTDSFKQRIAYTIVFGAETYVV